MLDAGVYLAPSAFEAGFVSAAHGDAEIDGDDRRGPAARSLPPPGTLMRAVGWFLAAILGTLLLAALLACPVWQFAHALAPDWPFHKS